MFFAQAFTQPSFVLFTNLLTGWVICPGRRTVTRMLHVGDSDGEHAHDAYHRFFRAGRWAMTPLWKTLTLTMVAALKLTGAIMIDLDDTLFHKTGRKVNGASVYRDPVRSSRKKVVYAWGLNLVVLTLRVTPPWGGEPLGLPINLRLYRKGGPSHLELGEEMIREVADWLPDHHFKLSCDGAYASLLGWELPRTTVTTRMRRDAAIYEPPPPRKKSQPVPRGRPRKKGPRLPTPEAIARRRKKGWVRTTVEERGKKVKRLTLALQVMWYKVNKEQSVWLLIRRDPTGKQDDDFIVTNDPDAVPAKALGQYAGRWSIEDTNRNVKQFLGGEEPQVWKGPGPKRAAALSFWLSSVVWLWYLTTQGTKPVLPALPWFPKKCHPSFADALAALRRVLWRQKVFCISPKRAHLPKIIETLIEVLATAA